MKNFKARLFSILMFLLIVISCTQRVSSVENGQNQIIPSKDIQKKLIDYKSDLYKISIGENYKKSDKILDWRWAAMSDPDSYIDSSGIDAFYFTGEPLINYNSNEWLPSLHIETKNNLITGFKCSILFKLEDKQNAKLDFLALISKDIKRLKSDSIKSSIIKNGVYEKLENGIKEIYKITDGIKHDYDKFKYSISLNKRR